MTREAFFAKYHAPAANTIPYAYTHFQIQTAREYKDGYGERYCSCDLSLPSPQSHIFYGVYGVVKGGMAEHIVDRDSLYEAERFLERFGVNTAEPITDDKESESNNMSNQKHTPGPWKVCKNEDSGDVVVRSQSDQGIVANCQCDSFALNSQQDFEKEINANARLIAAAPEMLAALEACVKYQEEAVLAVGWCSVEEYRSKLNPMEWYSLALEAITKATNQQSC